jgi:vancomycin resistance protein VanJ
MLAKTAVAAIAAAGLALALGYQIQREGWWWLELIHYAPYPIHLAAAGAALLLSIGLGRAWRLLAAFTLGLVVTAIMGLAVGRPDDGSVRVRLMTYNVKAWKAEQAGTGFAPLAREVAEHDPDILVMQDAGELATVRAQAPDTAATIFDKRQVYTFGQYIVVSQFPLRECRPQQIPYSGQSHTYVRCIVTARGFDTDLVVVHFRSPRDGLNATRHEHTEGLDDWRRNYEERMAQAVKLAADLSRRDRPVIVAGDLNAPESSPVVRRLLQLGLRDAFSSAGLGYGYTHGHSLRLRISFLRIDHILVSHEIGVHDAWAGGKEASEHRPVIADLLMLRQND